MYQLRLLERLFANGEISRREFLTRISALGLTAAVSPILLRKTSYASGPIKGGRLRIGSSGGAISDSLDPATLSDMMPWNITWQCRNNLVEIDHNNAPIPELAESWESSPGAKRWIFKLRKGVEFHNGKSFVADDVVFSLKRHRDEKSKSAAKAILKPIKDIKVDGKHTVEFILEEGNADFPFILADFHLQIVPAGTTDFEDGMGTGGYRLVSHEPGVRALAKRNPNYWKEGRAHFDEVETIGIADVTARTNALQTGQVDFINRCDSKTYHMLKKAPGIQGIETTGFKHYTFTMSCDRPPFNNNDARLAMKYAIDRDQMIKTILRGHGLPGNDHPISQTNRYHNSELAQRTYDPEKAKFHLKKAGLEGETFNLYVADAGFPGAVDAAVLYKEQAAKAEININVVKEPNDGYWSNVWMKKTWCSVFWGGRPTEDWMFSTAYAADAPWNDSFWKHERFNKLLVDARAELNEDKRRAMYYEMQEIVSNEGGAVLFAFVSDLMAANKKLKFSKLASDWEMDGVRLAERWWFES